MPGGWVPEQKESSGGMSQLMLVIVTMALTAGVFFLGRKLFGG